VSASVIAAKTINLDPLACPVHYPHITCSPRSQSACTRVQGSKFRGIVDCTTGKPLGYWCVVDVPPPYLNEAFSGKCRPGVHGGTCVSQYPSNAPLGPCPPCEPGCVEPHHHLLCLEARCGPSAVYPLNYSESGGGSAIPAHLMDPVTWNHWATHLIRSQGVHFRINRFISRLVDDLRPTPCFLHVPYLCVLKKMFHEPVPNAADGKCTAHAVFDKYDFDAVLPDLGVIADFLLAVCVL
jgi:hypothetical protein